MHEEKSIGRKTTLKRKRAWISSNKHMITILLELEKFGFIIYVVEICSWFWDINKGVCCQISFAFILWTNYHTYKNSIIK